MTPTEKAVLISEIGFLRNMLSSERILELMIRDSLSFEQVLNEIRESVDKIGSTVLGDEYNEIMKP